MHGSGSTIGAQDGANCTTPSWPSFVAAAVAASSVNAVAGAYGTGGANWRGRVRDHVAGKGVLHLQAATAWSVGEGLRRYVAPRYASLAWASGLIGLAAAMHFDVFARVVDALARGGAANRRRAVALALLAFNVAENELGFEHDEGLYLARNVCAALVAGADEDLASAYRLAKSAHYRAQSWRLEMAALFDRPFLLAYGASDAEAWQQREARLQTLAGRSGNSRLVAQHRGLEAASRMEAQRLRFAEARHLLDAWAWETDRALVADLAPLITDEHRRAIAWGSDQPPSSWLMHTHPHLYCDGGSVRDALVRRVKESETPPSPPHRPNEKRRAA